MSAQFSIEWEDFGREPRCAPNPVYPNGIDVDATLLLPGPRCVASLPYPAKRCGLYTVHCTMCGSSVALTTAGRVDDPRSVALACKSKGSA
jgi:hypothetical protein